MTYSQEQVLDMQLQVTADLIYVLTKYSCHFNSDAYQTEIEKKKKKSDILNKVSLKFK